MKCNRAAVIPKRATERLIRILVTTLGYRISGIGCHRIQRFSHDKNQARTGMHWDVRPLLVLILHPEGRCSYSRDCEERNEKKGRTY